MIYDQAHGQALRVFNNLAISYDQAHGPYDEAHGRASRGILLSATKTAASEELNF
jgi:hypothetical protein